MRNISAKADGVGDTLPATDFNANLRSELQNVVTSSDQTLDPEGGPDTDVEMLGKAITIYANASQYYQDSGAADAYVLSRVGNLKALTDYIDGVVVWFKIGNTNTGASTVNVDSLGTKNITLSDGSALSAGRLKADQYVMIRYNSTSDRFEIVNGIAINTEVITTSSTYTPDDNVLAIKITAIGGGGGGGGVDGQTTSAAVGGSGGGAGACILSINDVDTGGYTITIGAGGSGGTGTGGNSGSAGGDTTVVATGVSMTANGGGGGTGAVATASYLNNGGGSGGASSGGDLNFYGSGGTNGTSNGTTFLYGGASGVSLFAGGRRGGGGTDGLSPGSGGSGASTITTADNDGGDGADGIVIVEEIIGV